MRLVSFQYRPRSTLVGLTLKRVRLFTPAKTLAGMLFQSLAIMKKAFGFKIHGEKIGGKEASLYGDMKIGLRI